MRTIHVKSHRRIKAVVVEEYQGRKTFSGLKRKPRKATKEGVRRYPGGQTHRADRGESERSVLKTATEARQRHFGVSAEKARDPRLATILGRCLLVGGEDGISKSQHDAAVVYAKIRHWSNVLDNVPVPHGMPAAARLATQSGRHPFDRLDPEMAWDDVDAKRRKGLIADIRRQAAELTAVVWNMEANLATRGAGPLLERVIMWDDEHVLKDARNMGLLRCGLNEVAHALGVAG